MRSVDRWIDTHRQEIIDLTCRLVSIDTTIPPGRNYPRIAQVLASELKDLKIAPSVSYIPESTIRRKADPELGLKGPRPNVTATLNGKGPGPKIVLNGHMDVVPAQPTGWTSDPFKPTIRNGKIYGRGSADMKGSDAALVYSLKALVESEVKFNGSIIPTFTTDEEVGGYTGVNHFIDKHVITKDIDYCLSPDTNIEAIDIASLGDKELLITVHGKSAHSGRGWTGVNSIEHAASLIERLKKLGVEVGHRRSKVPTEPVFGNKWMKPGLYVTMIKGGLKGNIIPDSCDVLVDRRYIPEEKGPDVEREVDRVVRTFSKETGVKASMKLVTGYAPLQTPVSHPLVKVVRRAAKKVLGHDVPPRGSQGSTDVAQISALGIPTAILGASRSDSNIHGVNEHVRINDIINVTKIFAHCYLELLGGSSSQVKFAHNRTN